MSSNNDNNDNNSINNSIHKELEDIQLKLLDHSKRIERIETGFANDDPLGHRLSHEKQILNARQRNDLKEKTIEKVVTGLVWGILLGIGYLVFEWLKRIGGN